MAPPEVVVLRGTSANPWDLRPWEELEGQFSVTIVVPGDNEFDVSNVRLRQRSIRTVGGIIGGTGAFGRLPARALGQRYIGLANILDGADIVHAAEIGNWYSGQAAALRSRLGFRLALTVWETLPFMNAYRNVRTRRYRRRVLRAADLFLPTTERAREALLLEGADAGRIRVSPPGVPFRPQRDPKTENASGRRLVLSIGRLVWEKGHQDVLRALAVLHRRGHHDLRLMVVGVGPEERRLRRVAEELGLAHAVEFRGWVPHDQLGELYERAACLVLASQSTWFWEEQFGMVLIEAMAARLPICASASGAIPEVLGGTGKLFSPGDWLGLADALQAQVLPRSSAGLIAEPGSLDRYSTAAAAERLAGAYRYLLAQPRS